MEITDVTTIDQLTDAEVDELLARALNPRTPIEVFYAVLDRIGAPAAAPADTYADQDPDSETEPGPGHVPEHESERESEHELADVGAER
jgi:hypothetical protein